MPEAEHDTEAAHDRDRKLVKRAKRNARKMAQLQAALEDMPPEALRLLVLRLVDPDDRMWDYVMQDLHCQAVSDWMPSSSIWRARHMPAAR
jgi:hypothetical protein